MNGFNREELQAPLAEINMTPLVDVMLVLLVIFLVTAPMINSAIQLNLPKEKAAPIVEQKALNISLKNNQEIYFEEQKVDEVFLEKHLCAIAKENPKQQIHLRADKDLPYGAVSHIMAMIQNCGIANVGFITQEK